MTGAFFYRPGPAGTGWKLLADSETESNLLPLLKTVLVSDNYPTGRTTIGHIARDTDFVVIVHKDRRLAGRLIDTSVYEACGFNPFAVASELPAVNAALRASVAWGDAIAAGALPAAIVEAALGGDTVLWQAPTDTLAIALAHALFLAGAPAQCRATYFSLLLQDLPYRRSVLTRFADNEGQPPPPALLAAARALPDAAAETLSVTLALPSGTATGLREQGEPGHTLTSVRTRVTPSSSPPLATSPQHRNARAATAASTKHEETTSPTPETFPPMAGAPAPRRVLPQPVALWWLPSAAAASIAMLLVAWIGSEMVFSRRARSDVSTRAEAAAISATKAENAAMNAVRSADTAASQAKAAAAALGAARAALEKDQATLDAERAVLAIERTAFEAARKAAMAKITAAENTAAEIMTIVSRLEAKASEIAAAAGAATAVRATAERLASQVRQTADNATQEAERLNSARDAVEAILRDIRQARDEAREAAAAAESATDGSRSQSRGGSDRSGQNGSAAGGRRIRPPDPQRDH